MARDPLQILLALRQRAVEHARQALAVCLRAEAEATEWIGRLDDMTRRDRAAVVEEAHRFLDLAAVRSAKIQADRRAAHSALATAEAGSSEARVVLAAARTAAELVEQLIAERAALARNDEDRREQHRLDDIARTIRRANASMDPNLGVSSAESPVRSQPSLTPNFARVDARRHY